MTEGTVDVTHDIVEGGSVRLDDSLGVARVTLAGTEIVRQSSGILFEALAIW